MNLIHISFRVHFFLCSDNLLSSNLVESIIALVRNQLSSSETIKNNMQLLIVDSKMVLNGSAKNIDLGQQLISHLDIKHPEI